jgi:hypothetical protein
MACDYNNDFEGETRRALLSLLKKYARCKVINDGSRLFQDLTISGDDAGELLSEVGTRFNTSFMGFPFATYFPNETEALGAHWAGLIGFSKPRPPLTFGHLLAVVKAGHWFEPDKLAGEP